MSSSDDRLMTPIQIAATGHEPWLDGEPVFYRLAANGLFVCREHPFFRSCVPAPEWPSELAELRTSLEPRYPKVPRRLFELIVGFFEQIGEKHGAEAGVLLAWDSQARVVRPIVPPQTATVSRSSWSGRCYPIGLHYEVPDTLPPGWTLLGDVHSHVDEPAYSSGTDEHDEKHRAGLHIVVGRITREPPDLHVAAVVDRTRFRLAPELVIEGYESRRRKVPARWLEQVQVKVYGNSFDSYGSSNYSDWTSKKSYGYPLRPYDDDKGGRRGWDT